MKNSSKNSSEKNSPCDQLHTILDFIRFALSSFTKANLYYGHGTTNALDDAVALVLGALSLPPDTDNMYFQSNLTHAEKELLLSLIERRVETREPVAYLINKSYFAGLEFYVDNRVLIPRSPIAELIDNSFSPWIAADHVENILDIGTGSGCIAIACALFMPNAHVDAVDISEDALEVARKNVAHYNIEEFCTLIQSNIFEKVPSGKTYDLIITNPPYVPIASMSTLPQEYLHEPEQALVAGEDGLTIVDKILSQATKYLKPHGILVVEVGEAQPYLEDKYPFLPLTWIQFENGGDGVFILTYQELKEHLPQILKVQKTSK